MGEDLEEVQGEVEEVGAERVPSKLIGREQ
jgi:hypothetical protein